MNENQIPNDYQEQYLRIMGTSFEAPKKSRLKLVKTIKSILSAKIYITLPCLLQKVFRRTQICVRYSTIFALTIILALGPLAYIQIRKPHSAEAAWWDDSWMYRKTIEITNSGSAQTDFQVQVTADTATLISAGKMQSDCNDIRFTNINGKVLDQWLKEGCNTSSTEIWIKVPSIPTSGATVYLYYGNPGAPAKADLDQIFDTNIAQSWEFNTDDDNEGWGNSRNNMSTPSVSSGIWSSSITGTDPFFYSSSGLSVDASTRKYIFVKYRITSGNTNGGVFWITNLDGTWNEAKHHTDSYTFDGGWEVITEYVGENPEWANTVTQLRLDPSNNDETSGTVEVDWIRIQNSGSTLTSAGSPGEEENAPRPLAYWKFDEGYGTTANDATQNKNNGTINNAVWKDESMCLSGKCLYFDSSGDYVSISDSTNFDYSNFDSGNFSISVWFKIGTTSPSTNYHLISKDDASSQREWNIHYRDDTTDSLQFYTNGSNNANYSWSNDFQWHHLTAVVSGSNKYLYLDGRQVASNSYSAITGTAQNPAIGGYATTGTFSGFLDEVKIYPYARSADQIRSDYLRGGSTQGSSVVLGAEDTSFLNDGLVGYWKMDENSGNNTTDSSGNGLSGSVTAGTVISSGKFNNTRDFNSANTEGVIVSDNDLLEINATNSYSGFAWIKPDSVSTYYSVFHKRHGGCSEGYNFSLRTNATIELNMVENSVTYNTKSTATVTTSDWAFVGFTIDRTTNKATVYVNGQPSGTPADITNMIDMSNTCPFYIASWGPIGNGYFDGKIDEVRFYNRALSPAEVQDLYNWAPGPVGYWNFDEKTGNTLYDKSGNNLNSSSFGGSPIWSQGNFGGALKFNGSSDYVNIGTNSLLDITNAITIEGWVKLHSYYDPSWQCRLFGKQLASYKGYTIQFGDGKLWGLFGNGVDSWQAPIGTTVTPLETWVHLAVTYEANGYTYGYKNGKLEYGPTAVGNLDPNAGASFLINESPYHCNASIDEIRIYNYARSAKQIVEDMNAGHPIGGSPVGSQVGYWKFDEGCGNTTYDSGTGGNNGIITGASWTNQGKVGKALDFVADSDRADFSTDFSEITEEITVSAWIRPDSAPIGEGRTAISTYDWDATPANIRGWNLGTVWGSADNFPFVIYDSSGNSASASDSDFFTNYLNTWVHVAGVFKSAEYLRLYINGKLESEDTTSVPSAIAYSGVNLRVGSRADSTTQGEWDGLIDEVKIYSSALTEDEIRLDYNQGKVIVLGSLSTSSDGKTASFSAERAYCIPGDTTSCSAPVAEWKFDEKTGGSAYDTSGNGYNGTISGATWTRGKIGAGLQFNGSGNNVDNTSVSYGDSFTIEAWIKPTNLSLIEGYGRTIVASSPSSADYYPIWLLVRGNQIRAYAYSNSSSAYYQDSNYNNIQTNNWYHVALSATKNGTANLYINGEFDSSFSAGPQNANSKLTAGDLRPGRNIAFQGTLDYFRLYDYARTQAQIAWDYNRGGPIGWWKFDECQGNTIYDSRFTNNGTLNLGASGQTSAGTCPENANTAWYNGKNGKYSSSLNFDGTDDRTVVPDNEVFHFNSAIDFSVSLWIKASGNGLNTVIMNKGNNNNTEKGWRINTNSSSNSYLRISDGTNQANSSTISYQDGNWHNLTFTIDRDSASGIKAYKDGALIGSTNPTSVGDITRSDRSLVFMANTTGGNGAYNGQIDDVRVYNYALTDYQVKQLFNESSAVRFGPTTGTP